MIINGSIPGDPTEVAKAMAGKAIPSMDVAAEKKDISEAVQNEEKNEKPVEKKVAKKSTRKSSKKAESEVLFPENLDNNEA